jgi:hypothetical protein
MGQLNQGAAPSPKSQPARLRGWSASTVRDVLHRELYRGEVVWGRTKKRDLWGLRQSRSFARRRPQDDWTRVAVPELRILSDEAWEAAHKRLWASRPAYLRATNGQLHGRPVNGVLS